MDYYVVGIVLLVVLVILWIVFTSNSLNRTIVKIEESESGIDVALTKRFDVLTKLIEVVKGYAKHERETLFEVVNLRSGMTTEEKIEANNKMDSNFEKIRFLAESYPELRASENYKQLQQAIVEVEEHLQASRRMYNSNVSIFNQMLVTFPTSVIAKLKKLTKKSFFEAEEHKKKDIEVNL